MVVMRCAVRWPMHLWMVRDEIGLPARRRRPQQVASLPVPPSPTAAACARRAPAAPAGRAKGLVENVLVYPLDPPQGDSLPRTRAAPFGGESRHSSLEPRPSLARAAPGVLPSLPLDPQSKPPDTHPDQNYTAPARQPNRDHHTKCTPSHTRSHPCRSHTDHKMHHPTRTRVDERRQSGLGVDLGGAAEAAVGVEAAGRRRQRRRQRAPRHQIGADAVAPREAVCMCAFVFVGVSVCCVVARERM